MDDQILTLYAKGLSNREIVAAFKKMYDADVSATLVSKVTERVLEQTRAGNPGPWTPSIRLCTLIALSLRFEKRKTVTHRRPGASRPQNYFQSMP